MNYKQGIARNQLVMFQTHLDQVIDEDNPVRFMDEYIDNLDLKKLGFNLPCLITGTPPYDPKVLLKIYVYCYFQKIRSSRKIEIECKRNQELIWLTCYLAPDFKTIADFRKNNRNGLHGIFKEFLLFCKSHDLLSLDIVAVDGTKMRGQNSLNEIYKRSTIEGIEAKVNEKINEYFTILDENDNKESEDLKLDKEKVKKMRKKLHKLQNKKERVEKVKKQFAENPEINIIFGTDADTRLQSDKGKVRPGYNPQIGTESKNKLIIVNEVTNDSNDLNQASPMKEKISEVKKTLGIDQKTKILFDAGYDSEKNILENMDDEENISLIQDRKDAASKNKKNGKKKRNKKRPPMEGFENTDFKYIEEDDEYECPDDKRLKKSGGKIKDKNNREVFIYKCQDCKDCVNLDECTSSKNGRMLKVSAHAFEIEAYKNWIKNDENKKTLSQRKEMVEHPFGTFKRNLGFDYFMQRGQEKVRAEFSFMSFIYNFKRVINIFKSTTAKRVAS